jgi:uncharacterized protein YbjT (DUF2867 family)
MSVILVTGGSGLLGGKLVPILAARGHQVRVLSRRPGAGTHVGDLATGSGLSAAADGAELIVHAASDRRFGRSDPEQTRQLLAVASRCRHLLYVSIVGVDAIPFGYYRTKLGCEGQVAASAVPSTTLRATQFHELLDRALRTVGRFGIAPLPLALRFQSVAASEVAARIAELVEGEPLGRAPDFGGPQVLTARQIAEIWRQHHRRPRVVFSVRLPGKVYRGFAAGAHTCPQHADGRQTWAEFVRAAPRGTGQMDVIAGG